MIITGKANLNLFRMKLLLVAITAEINNGLQLTRGRSAYSIIKSEYGLKGNKRAVYYQFKVLYTEEYEKVHHATILG